MHASYLIAGIVAKGLGILAGIFVAGLIVGIVLTGLVVSAFRRRTR